MACRFAKRQRPGVEKPYQVCLHLDTGIVKCWNEEDCPLLRKGGEPDESEVDSTKDVQELLDLYG